MIFHNSTVQKKFFNKGVIRVGIESVKVGDYLRAINTKNLEYELVKVISIVKVKVHKCTFKTSTLESIECAKISKFFCLNDSYSLWTPDHSFSYDFRLVKRKNKHIYTPFVKEVQHSTFTYDFYDLVIEGTDVALLVDGYARIF